MITYDYQDAEGHYRGDMGKGKPKVARIYKLERVDKENQLAHVISWGVYGEEHRDIYPLHTVCPLPEPIKR